MTATDHGPAPSTTRNAWPRSPLFFFLGIFVFVGLLVGAAGVSDSFRSSTSGVDTRIDPSGAAAQTSPETDAEERPDPLSPRGSDSSPAEG
ncbi:MAG: hypothetical protein AAGH64_11095 [Planctomycetota bacterium]